MLPVNAHPALKKLINKIKNAGEADFQLIESAIANEFTLCQGQYPIEGQPFLDALYNLAPLSNSYTTKDIIDELVKLTSFPRGQVEKKWELMINQEHDTQKVEAHVVE
jgi:hypothetical protein